MFNGIFKGTIKRQEFINYVDYYELEKDETKEELTKRGYHLNF